MTPTAATRVVTTPRGMAPGTEPFQLPDGAGRLLVPGSHLYFSMHYHKEPGVDTGVWDRSQMAFTFHPKDAKIDRIVKRERRRQQRLRDSAGP